MIFEERMNITRNISLNNFNDILLTRSGKNDDEKDTSIFTTNTAVQESHVRIVKQSLMLKLEICEKKHYTVLWKKAQIRKNVARTLSMA